MLTLLDEKRFDEASREYLMEFPDVFGKDAKEEIEKVMKSVLELDEIVSLSLPAEDFDTIRFAHRAMQEVWTALDKVREEITCE